MRPGVTGAAAQATRDSAGPGARAHRHDAVSPALRAWDRPLFMHIRENSLGCHITSSQLLRGCIFTHDCAAAALGDVALSGGAWTAAPSRDGPVTFRPYSVRDLPVSPPPPTLTFGCGRAMQWRTGGAARAGGSGQLYFHRPLCGRLHVRVQQIAPCAWVASAGRGGGGGGEVARQWGGPRWPGCPRCRAHCALCLATRVPLV